MSFSTMFGSALVFLTLTASGQDWQDCKPGGDFSFKEIKESVSRITTLGVVFGFDDPLFARSGDLVAVAILKTMTDREMASPKGARNVLLILRVAFGCPQRCVKAVDDQRPRVASLLLDHLRKITPKSMHSEIDDTNRFILRQAGETN